MAKVRKNSSWSKLSNKSADETLANRDVYEGQQLDRSEIQEKRSTTPGYILALSLGALVTIVAWFVYSALAVVVIGIAGSIGTSSAAPGGSTSSASSPYFVETTVSGADGSPQKCFTAVDEHGYPEGTCYDSQAEVPVPDWYKVPTAQPSSEPQAPSPAEDSDPGIGEQLFEVNTFKLFVTLGLGLMVAGVVATYTSKRVNAANLMHDTSDINQHTGDQHIALPEEIQRKFDWFPDAGAHSAVQVSSMISHMMLQRKGLKKVELSKRATADVIDQDGNLVYLAGEMHETEDGHPVTESVPMIDEAFGTDLFVASGITETKLQKCYDTTQIPYNPDGKDRDKLGNYKSVADLINDDWELPDYEVQRPAGAFMVDTAPVNTMVLAITRAGKGQTYIEPMLDMWSREKRPSNMVINDPKGELLVKNYVPFVTRGYELMQFNLINAMKTDIYNPLGMAADAAREGDSTKCAQYVEAIADVFFPTDGGEDPVWPNAANNAFKRAAYGLIDFYLEEERELRSYAAEVSMDPETLENKLDDMWGKVTLYNCYQLFVQLTSKKIKNPESELEKRVKAGEFDNDTEALAVEQEQAEKQAFLWEGKPEQDMLTLYFNATEALPTNTMRTLIGNANNALRAMAGAEKMLASVYGIAITAMSFFTDPTISTLTSGKPSQNADLGGLSFPRRVGVRFAQNYLKRDHLMGMQAMWSAYGDAQFSEPLGEDFDHSDIVSREGWARYYFKGIFPADNAWLKLELVNPQTKMLIRTFFFHFKKNYQVSLNGRHYVVEPVTGHKVVKNGVIRELKQVEVTGETGPASYKVAHTTYPQERLDFSASSSPEKVKTRSRAIISTMVRYSEAPKAVFLVTPPHLMKYAKLLLILIKQLVDLNFDRSYMTKSNQKPLYKTRFMLDELGNLQSEGHGIAGLETMLSIGLGQEQQFTLILQTLQQLIAVYGNDVDKVLQGNISNIVFLKSTDDSMIETLEKMSGKRHKAYIESKQISQDLDKIVGGKTEGRVSYTMATKEEPVISYNDMAFIAERNSMVFRAGDAPVWNRNETVLPMSWRLFKDKITHPGHDYTLQTIPTMSSAMEFDVRMNQPDFTKMLNKRVKQAVHAAEAKGVFAKVYKLSDIDIARLDPDVYSDEVMTILEMMTNVFEGRDPHAVPEVDDDDNQNVMFFDESAVIDNVEVAKSVGARSAQLDVLAEKIYAEGLISRDMLINPDGSAKRQSLDKQITEAYKVALMDLQTDRRHFQVGTDDELRSADGSTAFITPVRSEAYTEAASKLNAAAQKSDSHVFSDDEVTADDLRSLETVRIHGAFYEWLASLPSWEHLADGAFDRAMAVEMRNG